MNLARDREKRLIRKTKAIIRKLMKLSIEIGRLETARAHGQATPTPAPPRKAARKRCVRP